MQSLLEARALEDVRAAIAHATRLVTRYDTLSLYEVQPTGDFELTLRHGERLNAAAAAVEELFAARVKKTGQTISTIQPFADPHDRETICELAASDRLCLVRPFKAYSEVVAFAALHFHHRLVLPDAEFDAFRRLGAAAGAALSNARTRAELRNFAYTDPLTGLANRRRLESEFHRLSGSPMSLLLIDFDGLKAVNDELGYEAGDALIRAVGVALSAAARPDEFVVRFGGDEFVVLVGDGDPGWARTRAEELTRTLDGLRLAPELAPLFRGASVGWASAANGEAAAAVLRRAGIEMRSRKRRRNTDRAIAEPESRSPIL